MKTTMLTARTKAVIATSADTSGNRVPRTERSIAIGNALGRTFLYNNRWYGVNRRRKTKAFATKSEAMRWAKSFR